MRSVPVMMLLAFIAQVHTKELASNHLNKVQASMDHLAEDLVGRFFDRMHIESPLDRRDLDNATVGKASYLATLTSPLSPLSTFSSPRFLHSPQAARRAHPITNVIMYRSPNQKAMQSINRGYRAGVPLRRQSPSRFLVAAGEDDDEKPALQIGDKVRVVEELKFMHVPGNKEGYSAKGVVGTVIRIYGEDDRPDISVNRPVKVEFPEPKKWIAHFEDFELERVPE